MANETQIQAPSSNTTNRVMVLYGANTDVGGRPLNEDNVTIEMKHSPDKPYLGNLFAVADGMGGGSAGGTASSIALGTLADQYFEVREASANPLENLQRAVGAASRAVFAFTQSSSYDRAVGTTMVAAAVTGARVHIVNVGDSRAYLVRGGQLQPLTRDHNWANQQIEQGMPPEQANNHKNAPLLTHALGQSNTMPFAANGQPDGKFSFIYELQPSDVLLLCSDGLAPVPEHEIVRAVTSNRAATAAKHLTDLAKKYGTTDNVSAAVYQYGPPAAAAAVAPKRAARPRPQREGAGFPLLPVFSGVVLVFVLLLAALVLPSILSGSSNAGNSLNGRPQTQTGGGSSGSGGSSANDPAAEPEPTTAPGVATSTPLALTATPVPATSDPPTPADAGAPPTLIPTLPAAEAIPGQSPQNQQQTQQVINATNAAIQSQQQTANAAQAQTAAAQPAAQPPAQPPTEPEPTATPTPEPTTAPVPQLVAVPNVVGVAAGDAYSILGASGLQGAQFEQSVPGCAPFVVVSQEPSAGAQVPPGSTVSFGVCPQGPLVPAVVGLQIEEAQAILTAAGFQVVVTTYADSRFRNGYVGSQNPPPQQPAPDGVVTLGVIQNPPSNGGDDGRSNN